MKHTLLTFLTVLLLATFTGTADAAILLTDTAKNLYQMPGNPYPALPASVGRLFYVQRSSNANTIVYELNLGSNGQPDADEPVHPYWIRYTEGSKKADLSYIQRKFAYGVNAKALGNGKFDIRFVSYKKFPLTLMKGSDGKYHIFATISQKLFIVNRIFVKIEGGSFWVPNVRYVEFKGTDPATGKEVTERFKP
jgi:hypothetical protein